MSTAEHHVSIRPTGGGAGSVLGELWEFRELLIAGGTQYCRPDVGLAGGITHTKKIAAVAESFHAGMIPHNFLGPILTAASVHLLFFGLELNRIDDAVIERAMQAPELAHYRPWIEDLRKDKPYQLEDRVEQLFHEKSVSGYAAWNRLFDQTISGLRFKVGGKELAIEPTLNLLQDRAGEKRKAAGQALTDKTLVTGFGAIVGTLEYMSPEHAEVNQLDVDTRSDVYSLGVLLYELLAGSTPFSKKDLERAGILEMLRVIRED